MRYFVFCKTLADYERWNLENWNKQSTYITSAKHFRDAMRSKFLTDWVVIKLNGCSQHYDADAIEQAISAALAKKAKSTR